MCSVEGCEKPGRSAPDSMCPMHYHRQYRHGDVTKTARAEAPSVYLGRRYKSVMAHGHPLAPASGRVYVHRLVLFDKIGPGEHACHWCQRTVRWSTRGDSDGLYPDHLNDVGDDNRPENLVPSCMSCNNTRAAQRRADALRRAGWWSGNDTIAHLNGVSRKPQIKAA